MGWPQTKSDIDPLCLEYIKALDPVSDIAFLKETMPFRDTCLRNIRISGILLKKGADSGLTLDQIGSMLYRNGNEQSLSVIEEVVSKATSMYKTIIKSLSSRLKLEKCLSTTKKQNSRPRAYSTNEMDFWNSGDSSVRTESSTPGEGDNSCELVLTIPEKEESEEEDSDFLEMNDLTEMTGRSISLPCFVKLNPKLVKEKNEAFDKRLFYYIEAFIDMALQKKVMDLLSKIYLEYTTSSGRQRSFSEALYEQTF